MTKKESKGQRVSTFTHWITQPDLTKVKTQVVVYLKADEGAFYIYQGAHIFEACQDRASRMYELDKVLMSRTHMSCATMRGLTDAFDTIDKQYETLLREQSKTRVIRFRFKRNVQISWVINKSDISFCGSPALHFDFELLWKVGDKLYRQDDPEAPLQFAGQVKDRFDEGHCDVIDWTPERETFFQQMRDGLIGLIERVEEFAADLTTNVDLAIAGGSAVLLPAPRPRPTKEDVIDA